LRLAVASKVVWGWCIVPGQASWHGGKALMFGKVLSRMLGEEAARGGDW